MSKDPSRLFFFNTAVKETSTACDDMLSSFQDGLQAILALCTMIIAFFCSRYVNDLSKNPKTSMPVQMAPR